MVAGADGDAPIVQYGAGVVRVHPVDIEADDPRAVLRPVEGDSRDVAECLARLGDQRAFVRMDRVERQFLDPIDRGLQPDRADDVRSAGFEPHRRIEIRGLLERDLLDHRAAALPRRQALEQAGAAPQAADPGWPVELVRRISVEVAADGGDSDRQSRHRLAAVEQQQRALRMRDLPRAPRVEDRA